MPHHKSAKKRVITNEKARRRNIALRTRLRNALKAVRQSQTADEAAAANRAAAAILDRTWAKGVLPRATASRYKARLARHASKVSS